MSDKQQIGNALVELLRNGAEAAKALWSSAVSYEMASSITSLIIGVLLLSAGIFIITIVLPKAARDSYSKLYNDMMFAMSCVLGPAVLLVSILIIFFNIPSLISPEGSLVTSLIK